MEVSINISGDLEERLGKSVFEGAYRTAIRTGMENAGRDIVFTIVRGMRDRVWKTGFLASTIRSRMMDDVTLKIGSSYDADFNKPVEYAAQRHFGGPISPKRTTYLAWPVSPEYGGIIPTPSGVGGINARDAAAAPDYRSMGAIGTFVRPSASGKNKILFFKFPGKGKKSYRPAYVLSKGVVQSGDPFLLPVVEENAAMVVDAIEEAIKAAGLI